MGEQGRGPGLLNYCQEIPSTSFPFDKLTISAIKVPQVATGSRVRGQQGPTQIWVDGGGILASRGQHRYGREGGALGQQGLTQIWVAGGSWPAGANTDMGGRGILASRGQHVYEWAKEILARRGQHRNGAGTHMNRGIILLSRG